MNFHILTLFPEMIQQGLDTSIIGRAQEKGLISIEAVNIRDYTTEKHGKVDDYPYGGGAGMLMQAQPVYDCWKAVTDQIYENRNRTGNTDFRPVRTVYLTPQGRTFTQRDAHSFSTEDDLILLCGHYEGIDERVLETVCTDYISIGDYVLTGGELPAMIVVDAVSRLVPGVLHNETSPETESFESGLLEYPQYSRPEIWNGEKVPDILLSGDHKKVDAWRRIQAILRTRDRRPDLLEKAEFSKEDRKLLKQVELSDEDRDFLRKLLQSRLDSDRL